MKGRRVPGSVPHCIDQAYEYASKMIERDEYSASFIGLDTPPPPTDREALNNWVKDRIRLYLESWVLPHLKRAKQKLEKKDANRHRD